MWRVCVHQAVLQLPSEASCPNMDHRQGTGECGILSILEEDPCGRLQVGLPVGSLQIPPPLFVFSDGLMC